MSDVKYSWKYITSGKINQKIYFVCCENDKEVARLTDINYAIRYQEEHTEDFENDVKDYALDQKAAIEARWKNEKYVSKIELTKDSEWKKTQKKLEKPKQGKF